MFHWKRQNYYLCVMRGADVLSAENAETKRKYMEDWKMQWLELTRWTRANWRMQNTGLMPQWRAIIDIQDGDGGCLRDGGVGVSPNGWVNHQIGWVNHHMGWVDFQMDSNGHRMTGRVWKWSDTEWVAFRWFAPVFVNLSLFPVVDGILSKLSTEFQNYNSCATDGRTDGRTLFETHLKMEAN